MQQKKSYAYAWFVYGLAAAFFLAMYMGRIAPAVMTSPLIHAFHVNALSLGALLSFFYWPYIIMQIPGGALVDRFGPRRLLTVMAILSFAGAILFAVSTNLIVADAGRLLMGFGGAFAFVGSVKIASSWLPRSQFGMAVSITQGLGMLGAAMAASAVAPMVHAFNWRLTMIILGAVVGVVGLIIAIFMRDNPPGSELADVKVATFKSLWTGFMSIMKAKQVWINGAYVGLLYAPTIVFAEQWGASYLSRVYNLDINQAGAAISAIFVGWFIGGPICGWISDKLERRKSIMVISALACFVCTALILYMPHLNLISLVILLFLYGVTNTGVGIGYALAVEIQSKKLAGISSGFANMASVLIGAAFLPVVGLIIDWQLGNRGHLAYGLHSITPHAFRVAMAALPVSILLAFVAACFVKETYCRSPEARHQIKK